MIRRLAIARIKWRIFGLLNRAFNEMDDERYRQYMAEAKDEITRLAALIKKRRLRPVRPMRRSRDGR